YRLNAPTYTPPATNTYPQAVNYGTLGAVANGLYQPGTVPGLSGPPILNAGPKKAVGINGLNAAVEIPYNSVIDPTGQTPFSITAWFKANPTDGDGRWIGIFAHSDMSWRFQMNNGVPYFDFGGVLGGLAPDVNIGTGTLGAAGVNDAVWHFFAGTYD